MTTRKKLIGLGISHWIKLLSVVHPSTWVRAIRKWRHTKRNGTAVHLCLCPHSPQHYERTLERISNNGSNASITKNFARARQQRCRVRYASKKGHLIPVLAKKCKNRNFAGVCCATFLLYWNGHMRYGTEIHLRCASSWHIAMLFKLIMKCTGDVFLT